MDTRIAIIGGGPVGLVAALDLARRGQDVVLVDENAETPHDLRASTWHPPTLDLLHGLGVAEPLIAQGLKGSSWQIRMHPSGRKAEFDLTLLQDETAHPYRLQVEQWRLCEILWPLLAAEAGVTLLRGARCTGIMPGDDQVTVALEDGRTINASWVIGADGARSTVRQAAGLEFDGKTYPERTILVTTPFPFEAHLPGLSNVNYCWIEGGRTFSLLRLSQMWRVSLYPEEGETLEDALDPARVKSRLEALVPGAGAEIDQIRPYAIHMRIAPSFRAGRVLLAGDAAHINSPSGGMGVNAGIHDAMLLTRALDKAITTGDDAGLDHYAEARREIAYNHVLKQADANRNRMQTTDPAWREQEMARLQAIAADPVQHREHLLKTSMIAAVRATGLI